MKKNIPNNSQGMSLLFVLYLIVLTSGALIIMGKLFPAYLENYYIVKTFKNIKLEDATTQMDNSKEHFIREKASQYFVINNIRDIKPENIMVDTSEANTKIHIKYDVESHLFYNIALVIHFDDTITVS